MYKLSRIKQDHNLIPQNIIYKRISELLIPKLIIVFLISVFVIVLYGQGCKFMNQKLNKKADEIRVNSTFTRVENLRNDKLTVEENIKTANIEIKEIENALGKDNTESAGSGEQTIYKVSNYILENKPSNLTLIMLEDSNTYITYSKTQGTGYIKNITDFEQAETVPVPAAETTDENPPQTAPASAEPAASDTGGTPADPAAATLDPEIVAQFEQNPYGVITLNDGKKVNPTTDEWNSYKAQYIELKSREAQAAGYEVNENGEKIDREILTHKESGLSSQMVVHGFATNRSTLSEFSDILSKCEDIESYKILAMEKIMLEEQEIHLFEMELDLKEEDNANEYEG